MGKTSRGDDVLIQLLFYFILFFFFFLSSFSYTENERSGKCCAMIGKS